MVARGVTLHLSTQYFPIVIATWFGVPSVNIIERYGAWLNRMADRAKKQGTKVVLLGDFTTAARPTPEVRRAMATAIERLTERHGDGFLGGSTIIGQPLMRAVVTMVLALTRQKIDFKPVKSLAAGFERTRQLMDAAGIPWPEGFDPKTYERPQGPQEPGESPHSWP